MCGLINVVSSAVNLIGISGRKRGNIILGQSNRGFPGRGAPCRVLTVHQSSGCFSDLLQAEEKTGNVRKQHARESVFRSERMPGSIDR